MEYLGKATEDVTLTIDIEVYEHLVRYRTSMHPDALGKITNNWSEAIQFMLEDLGAPSPEDLGPVKHSRVLYEGEEPYSFPRAREHLFGDDDA